MQRAAKVCMMEKSLGYSRQMVCYFQPLLLVSRVARLLESALEGCLRAVSLYLMPYSLNVFARRITQDNRTLDNIADRPKGS